jgi:hypothetical protein
MNRPYTSRDNAPWSFSIAQAELASARDRQGELIAVLAGYIDRFYNVRRLHSSPHHSPVEFEQLVSP